MSERTRYNEFGNNAEVWGYVPRRESTRAFRRTPDGQAYADAEQTDETSHRTLRSHDRQFQVWWYEDRLETGDWDWQ